MNGFDREAAGSLAAGVTAEAIGNSEDAAGRTHGPDGGNIFVRRLFLRRARAEDGRRAAEEFD